MPQESITDNEFVDATVGMNIPKNFIPSIEKVTVPWGYMHDTFYFSMRSNFIIIFTSKWRITKIKHVRLIHSDEM